MLVVAKQFLVKSTPCYLLANQGSFMEWGVQVSLDADAGPHMHHCYVSADVFRAVENGVDVFDGAYPYMVTQRDSALVFHLCWALDCKTVQHSMEINLGDERLVPYYCNDIIGSVFFFDS